jgi:hypothetical protein
VLDAGVVLVRFRGNVVAGVQRRNVIQGRVFDAGLGRFRRWHLGARIQLTRNVVAGVERRELVDRLVLDAWSGPLLPWRSLVGSLRHLERGRARAEFHGGAGAEVVRRGPDCDPGTAV